MMVALVFKDEAAILKTKFAKFLKTKFAESRSLRKNQWLQRQNEGF
jgi:hypothetical protein